MSSRAPGVTRIPNHTPGEAGIWVFTFGDLLVFALFFAVFVFYRGQNPTFYQSGQAHLDQELGAVNTVVLLSSSWLVVLGICAARERETPRTARTLFALAGLIGLCFPLIKFFEYREEVLAGNTPATNEFFMYYFVFTGIHLFHVLIGLTVIALMWRRAQRTTLNANDIRFLESGATFWHLVDLLWIVLFPLFYLMP